MSRENRGAPPEGATTKLSLVLLLKTLLFASCRRGCLCHEIEGHIIHNSNKIPTAQMMGSEWLARQPSRPGVLVTRFVSHGSHQLQRRQASLPICSPVAVAIHSSGRVLHDPPMHVPRRINQGCTDREIVALHPYMYSGHADRQASHPEGCRSGIIRQGQQGRHEGGPLTFAGTRLGAL